ncbi:hypothetical protein QQS21_009608 [Conoideocrella luteorostrata]|uniref:Uncharacterized protein n=1 Tax=Conoideocrella luteorostrata TaxID=1105319 RepID=A0AAJ0FVH0_9HYPO|nr:hypothetical protein QQS21_009608 [Conoideocrella luteorostrata]
MSPPPTTPTPRRFLLPKRPPASQTPLPQASQFQSTPRFGSSSVPRPTQRRAQSIEDVDEDGDDSHSVLSKEEDNIATTKETRLLDTIDVESAMSESQDTEVSQRNSDGIGDESGEQQWSPEGREAKRRRVLSISPCESSASLDNEEEDGRRSASKDHSPRLGDDERRTRSFDVPSVGDETRKQDSNSTSHQPTFRPAPRFKPVETDDMMADIFPLAFSPQRRGEKYLPGGLAAQLQSWLSEVKGWEGERQDAVKIIVQVVSPGSHMYLVKGKTAQSDVVKSYILAGEGKLTGLDKKAVVAVGSVVLLEEPAWEVELLGETWTVVCNWSVLP